MSYDITQHCQNCGMTRKEHGVKKPYSCKTRLHDTHWTPWTVEAYEASVEAGRAAGKRGRQ